jgi:hypothetical protein
MCLDCLKLRLKSIENYDKEVGEYLEKTTCECCKSFPAFLKSVNEDLKVLCLAKMKKYARGVSTIQLEKIKKFEGNVKGVISNRLSSCMEQLDESKENIPEGAYLNKATELQSLNNFIADIEEADNNEK